MKEVQIKRIPKQLFDSTLITILNTFTHQRLAEVASISPYQKLQILSSTINNGKVRHLHVAEIEAKTLNT